MQKALAPDISTWPDEQPQLIGSRCGGCTATVVQLGDAVRVEGRLTENDPEKLAFGREVELTMIPFATDASDPEHPIEIVTFAFQPV
jgi:hypothetical protein